MFYISLWCGFSWDFDSRCEWSYEGRASLFRRQTFRLFPSIWISIPVKWIKFITRSLIKNFDREFYSRKYFINYSELLETASRLLAPDKRREIVIANCYWMKLMLSEGRLTAAYQLTTTGQRVLCEMKVFARGDKEVSRILIEQWTVKWTGRIRGIPTLSFIHNSSYSHSLLLALYAST